MGPVLAGAAEAAGTSSGNLDLEGTASSPRFGLGGSALS